MSDNVQELISSLPDEKIGKQTGGRIFSIFMGPIVPNSYGEKSKFLIFNVVNTNFFKIYVNRIQRNLSLDTGRMCDAHNLIILS